jgi:hypothetical protein
MPAVEPVTSSEATTTKRPIVDQSPLGANMLAGSYWREVAATTHGLVRVRAEDGRIDVRLLGRGPALIRLGPPVVAADLASVRCTYPIVGGLLVGRPGGALSLEQVSGDPVVLRSTLTEYVPRLVGALYFRFQARLHSLITRRYFARLVREAR